MYSLDLKCEPKPRHKHPRNRCSSRSRRNGPFFINSTVFKLRFCTIDSENCDPNNPHRMGIVVCRIRHLPFDRSIDAVAACTNFSARNWVLVLTVDTSRAVDRHDQRHRRRTDRPGSKVHLYRNDCPVFLGRRNDCDQGVHVSRDSRTVFGDQRTDRINRDCRRHAVDVNHGPPAESPESKVAMRCGVALDRNCGRRDSHCTERLIDYGSYCDHGILRPCRLATGDDSTCYRMESPPMNSDP